MSAGGREPSERTQRLGREQPQLQEVLLCAAEPYLGAIAGALAGMLRVVPSGANPIPSAAKIGASTLSARR